MTPYQPYRRTVDRPQTPALRAMLLGRPQIGPTIIDHWRTLHKRRRRGLNARLTR